MANIPVNFEPFEPNSRPDDARPTEEHPPVPEAEVGTRAVFRTIEIQLPDGFVESDAPAFSFEPVIEPARDAAAPAVEPDAAAAVPSPEPSTEIIEKNKVLEFPEAAPEAEVKAVELSGEAVLETSSDRLAAVPMNEAGLLTEDDSIRLLMDLATLQEDLTRAKDQTQLARKHVEVVQEQLARVTAERNAANEQTLRLRAEFDNFRKRGEREKQEIAARARGEVILSALEVLDNLERALATGGAEGGDLPAFLQGVELIQKQFSDVLCGHGLSPVPAIGTMFDPAMHEAIATEETEDYKPNTVLEELKRGYSIDGKLLRPAMVRVAVRPPVVPDDDDAA